MKTSLRIMWIFTAVAALALAAGTINLIRETRQGAFPPGSVVQVTGEDNLVLLRDNPSESANYSVILENGDSVTILAVDIAFEEPWYQVEAEAGSGWLPESSLVPEAD